MANLDPKLHIAAQACANGDLKAAVELIGRDTSIVPAMERLLHSENKPTARVDFVRGDGITDYEWASLLIGLNQCEHNGQVDLEEALSKGSNIYLEYKGIKEPSAKSCPQ